VTYKSRQTISILVAVPIIGTAIFLNLKIRSYFILSLFLLSINCLGQDRVLKKKEIFVGIGSARYNGDLGNGYGAGSLLFSLGVKLNTEKRLHGNFNISIGSITGNELDYSFDNDASATPNTSFSSTIIGLNYELQFNIIDKQNLKVYFSSIH